MKILSLNHKPPFPPVDGGTAASAALLEALAKSHEVRVLAYATSKHPGSEWLGSRQLQQQTVAVAVDGTAAVLRCFGGLLSGSGLPLLLQRYRSPRYRSELRRLLADFNPDLVLVDGLPSAIWLDELDRCRVVYRSHNAEATILEERGMMSETKPGWRALSFERTFVVSRRAIAKTRQLERRATVRSERVLAISEGVAEYHRQLCEPQQVADESRANVEYLPVPMAIGARPMSLPASAFHLGAMDWWPNQQGVQWLLEEVWQRVLEQHPLAELRLAGRGCEAWFGAVSQRLRTTCMRGVIVDGTVASARDYVGTHGILLAPTLAGSGVKIKVLEAMASGRAVVTTSCGAAGLQVVDQEHLLIADEPADFARAVCRLFDSEKDRTGLGQRAQEYVAHHHEPAKIAEQFDRLLA